MSAQVKILKFKPLNDPILFVINKKTKIKSDPTNSLALPTRVPDKLFKAFLEITISMAQNKTAIKI